MLGSLEVCLACFHELLVFLPAYFVASFAEGLATRGRAILFSLQSFLACLVD